MGDQIGGLSLGAVPGVVFVGILLLGAILTTIVIVQRSRVRVLDVTAETWEDVRTGLALLDGRVRGLAEVLADTPALPATATVGMPASPADPGPDAAEAAGDGTTAGPAEGGPDAENGDGPATGVGEAQAHGGDGPAAEVGEGQARGGDGPAAEVGEGPAEAESADRGVAEQALADAQDRLVAAADLHATSAALPVSRRCRHVLLEGLAAVHAGYVAAGRDPGPVPPPPTAAPLVSSPVRVRVGTDEHATEHVALPAYAPGFRFCYSGGVFDVAEVPGGWYAEPFWEDLLAAGLPADG